jgi:glycine hydroxymethyltransferase
MTASSIYFQSFPYAIVPDTGIIDYDNLEKQAKIFKPRLIICGASAYPRDWDYARLRKIADKEGAWLLCDMAHTSGLVAAQELNSPFEFCDVVTTTTHKTLRGPRAGLIFFRKDLENAKDLEKRVNDAVFPACQGGPHNNVSRNPARSSESPFPLSCPDLTLMVIADHRRYCNRLEAGRSARVQGLRQAGYRQRQDPC